MKINRNTSIDELKEMFNTSFPGLQIEFYAEPHKAYQGSEKAKQLNGALTVEEISSRQIDAEFSISENMTTQEVESFFCDLFGLNAQIFRRSNKLWLQTSKTDNWTLKVQNDKGLHSLQA